MRENNVVVYFSIADFPLMNLNDLIQVANILKDMDASKLQVTSKEVLHLGLGHIKLFIDNYYDCLAVGSKYGLYFAFLGNYVFM